MQGCGVCEKARTFEGNDLLVKEHSAGKRIQCELITKKYDLVHIAAGDLLRAKIAAGTENGRQANGYMDKGQLVPNEIVVTMVKERLMRPDSQEKGWLLDGYLVARLKQ